MKYYVFVASLVFLLGLVFVPDALAQTRGLGEQITGQIDAGAGAAGFGTTAQDPRLIIAETVRIFLGFLGTIFLILILMSGYWLLVARGEDEKVAKAQKTALRAVIGLLITIISYGITAFVIGVIQRAANLVQ